MTVPAPLVPVAATSRATKRRPERREEIVRAALKLFHDQGYEATGVNDIGSASGMSGPGIYRHFSSKQEILEVAVLEAGVRATALLNAAASEADARARLQILATNLVSLALHSPDLTVIAVRERRHLSDSTRNWLDRYTRAHRKLWQSTLCETRPDLSQDEAAVMIRGAISLVAGSASATSRLSGASLAAVIEEMLSRALGF